MQIWVNVDVDHPDGAIAFYRDALGVTLGRVLFDGTDAEMPGVSPRIHPLVTRSSSPAACEGSGARLETGIRSASRGIATLGDAFGHGICPQRFSAGGYEEAG